LKRADVLFCDYLYFELLLKLVDITRRSFLQLWWCPARYQCKRRRMVASEKGGTF